MHCRRVPHSFPGGGGSCSQTTQTKAVFSETPGVPHECLHMEANRGLAAGRQSSTTGGQLLAVTSGGLVVTQQFLFAPTNKQ